MNNIHIHKSNFTHVAKGVWMIQPAPQNCTLTLAHCKQLWWLLQTVARVGSTYCNIL